MTNSALPVAEADITHRRHAIIEKVRGFVTAHWFISPQDCLPPIGLASLRVITHNLLRATATLAGGHHAVARGATLRRDLVTVPARFAARAQTHDALPAHGAGKPDGKPCGTTSSATPPSSHEPPEPSRQPLSTPPSPARPEDCHNKEKLVQASGSRMPPRHTRPHFRTTASTETRKSPIHGFSLRQRPLVGSSPAGAPAGCRPRCRCHIRDGRGVPKAVSLNELRLSYDRQEMCHGRWTTRNSSRRTRLRKTITIRVRSGILALPSSPQPGRSSRCGPSITKS